ncbi:MAG: LysR family transcriptional regulator [Fimbriimonadaceae bacterium]|nr:LysR family transcriptional regulator [Alphaproteobacteria bacterium]
MKNWDDARYLLAVARTGTFSAAAAALGVNQTTVSRRISRLEQDIGFSIFSLNSGHLTATDAGTAIIEECTHLESAAARLDQRVLSHSDAPVYRVTLASTENIASTVLAPDVAALRMAHENIRLTLLTSQQNVRLDQGDADLAIRLKRPRSGRFKVRKLADLEFAVYGANNLASHVRPPAWLGYSAELAHLPEAQWMAEHMAGFEPVLRTNNIAALANATATGAGLAMLPCLLADIDPDLRRMEPDPAPVTREIWLVIREEMHDYPPIRAVADWVIDAFSART